MQEVCGFEPPIALDWVVVRLSDGAKVVRIIFAERAAERESEELYRTEDGGDR